MKLNIGFYLVLISCFVQLNQIYANIHIVNTLIDGNAPNCSESCSLRSAIQIAKSGDTIDLQNIHGTLYIDQVINITDKKLHIIGPISQTLRINSNLISRIFFLINCDISLENLVLENAKGQVGGALFAQNGNLDITQCRFIDNIAVVNGGALGTYNCALRISRSHFESNSCQGFGGALYLSGIPQAVLISNSIIRGNSSNFGGAIYSFETTLHLTNSLISGNEAYNMGGAIVGAYSEFHFSNSTIAGNSAIAGGGIFTFNLPLCNLDNCIVAMNTAEDFSNFKNVSTFISGSHNLSDDYNGNVITGKKNHLSEIFFTENPPPPPSLKGNYNLDPNSPAIDMGDNALIQNDETDIDQDNDTSEKAPFDLNNNHRIYNDLIDIGAYEYGSTPFRFTIPTLSIWAIIILVQFLFILGFLALKQRDKCALDQLS